MTILTYFSKTPFEKTDYTEQQIDAIKYCLNNTNDLNKLLEITPKMSVDEIKHIIHKKTIQLNISSIEK